MRFPACLAVWLAFAACATRPDPAATALLADLDGICRAAAPAEIGVAYHDLESGRTALIRGDLEMHAASTMKLAVLLEVFRQHDQGRLDLDQPVILRNEFRSIVDGSPFALDPAGDSDPELFQRLGHAVPVRELARRMIVRSSNLATNLLIERVTPAAVQRTVEGLGARRMKVLRGVEDGKAFAQGRNNVVTAHDLLLLLQAIARGEAASPASCDAMLAILAGQEHREMIPAGLPAGTVVMHKTGWITRIHHDAAVVQPGRGHRFVLVVLTRGCDDRAESARIGARIAARCLQAAGG